jgi:hypothetical protein
VTHVYQDLEELERLFKKYSVLAIQQRQKLELEQLEEQY